jgi:hypothetical protein
VEKEKQENLPESGKKMFLETSELVGAADIGLGGKYQIYLYINGYKLAADALVDAGLNGQPADLDHYVYSVIFNYRQFLELSMKSIYLFYSSDTVEVKKQNITKVSHNLEKTWGLIEPLLNVIYTTPEEIAVMQAAKDYVIEFHNYDNNSFNFRYPFTKALITTLPSEKRIDVANLKERMEELYLFFGQSDGGLLEDQESKSGNIEAFKKEEFDKFIGDIDWLY